MDRSPVDTSKDTIGRRGFQTRASDAITAFCGNMSFVYVHTIIFAVWLWSAGFGHDHYPFNFLTMAVSLEAIYLSTFILISQNRQQELSEELNREIQERLLSLLGDVVDDEGLDQRNEELIQDLLHRIDVDHIQPLAKEVARIGEAVPRIEATLGRLDAR